MKKAAIICGLLLFSQCAYSEIVIDSLSDPEYLNKQGIYNPVIIEQTGVNPRTNTRTVTVKRTYNLNSGQLSKVERKVFGRTYVGDDATNRLQRLESNVFGAIQRGDERNRLNRLSTATQNYSNKYPEYAYNNYNRYYNYNNPYYNRYTPYRPYRRPGLREIWRAAKGGALTGYSPSINNSAFNNGYSWSNNFQNPFSQSTYSTYSNPYNSSGSTYNNFNNSNSYYTSAGGNPSIGATQFTDLFSNGASGSETYYDDGRYRKNLSSTSGGCGVKVIY